MRFRRVVLAGAMSACLVGVLGAGQAAAATGRTGDDPSGSPASGPLDGLTDTVQGLLGQGEHGKDPSGDPSPTPTDPDPSGPLSGVLPDEGSSNGSGASGGSGGVSDSHDSTGSHESTKSGSGGPLPLISDLPLPDPGESIPSHLCLPAQLQSALPSSIPTCLNLTVCKQGLVRDLEALPTVKLDGLAQYVQRVLGDLTACLTSLVPQLPTAAPTQPSEPPTTPGSPPHGGISKPAPPPAHAATPVKQEPNFTG